MCAALRAAARDEHVRAVVVRVDSPGGSAVASETIWREVSLLREAKPVIVSMGEVAASGGYYVACPADVIVALPATLTGSIGVFGGKVVVQGLLERLGVTTGTVSRGERALMFSARRGFDDGRARTAWRPPSTRSTTTSWGRSRRDAASRSPRSRPSRAAGYGRAATRSAPAWWTGWAGSATPCRSRARGRACRTQGLLERLGVTTGTVSRGDRALMFSSRRGFDDVERERLAASLDAVYDDFVAKVAQGRGLSVPEVEAVARGRVWTGRDAVDAGLVDRLGGLREALQLARSRAGLPDDAPVRPALRVSPLARLRRPTSSQDPRAGVSGRVPGLADVAAALGLPVGTALRMPTIRIR